MASAHQRQPWRRLSLRSLTGTDSGCQCRPGALLIGGGLNDIGTAEYVKRRQVLDGTSFIEPEGRTPPRKDASNSNRFDLTLNCKTVGKRN